ncbi:MAG: hypothetical protein MJ078_01355, partial [Clostridia bacterium]|nr:hypothetical protein [Clostridia bacterium]
MLPPVLSKLIVWAKGGGSSDQGAVMRKTLSLFLSLIILFVFSLTSCGGDAPGDAVSLRFRDALRYEYLKSLDGKTVSMKGYMASSSPVDGSFFFLMNLPYQNCPFCKPNTAELSNTMEVYPAAAVPYTEEPITVTGKLEVAADQSRPFTDRFGYTFCFRIVNAKVERVEKSQQNPIEQLAENGLLADLYKMYDFVHFTCAWPTYYVNSFTNAEGEYVEGYYLFPADAE